MFVCSEALDEFIAKIGRQIDESKVRTASRDHTAVHMLTLSLTTLLIFFAAIFQFGAVIMSVEWLDSFTATDTSARKQPIAGTHIRDDQSTLLGVCQWSRIFGEHAGRGMRMCVRDVRDVCVFSQLIVWCCAVLAALTCPGLHPMLTLRYPPLAITAGASARGRPGRH